VATPKQRTVRKPATVRARATVRKPAVVRNPATAAAAQDLAEAHRRAKAATTPIAKAATRRVVEQKLALYSPEAVKQAAALAAKATQPTSTPKRQGARTQRRSR
jgi:hypothetical protein